MAARLAKDAGDRLRCERRKWMDAIQRNAAPAVRRDAICDAGSCCLEILLKRNLLQDGRARHRIYIRRSCSEKMLPEQRFVGCKFMEHASSHLHAFELKINNA